MSSCKTCCFLDKSTRKEVCNAYLYGCRERKNGGYTKVWIGREEQLKDIGCPYWQPIILDARQMTIDDWLGDEDK